MNDLVNLETLRCVVRNRFACLCVHTVSNHAFLSISGVRMTIQPHPRKRVWGSCGCILTFVRGCMGISFHVHLPLIAVRV
jgi:hypothetical protein